MSAAGVEACLKRIQSHKGVVGTIVVNADGIPIKTDLDNANTLQYASACRNLTMLASNTVRDMDPQNELLIVRVSSRKNEMIIAPKEEIADKMSSAIKNDTSKTAAEERLLQD
ncbi:unnamed protein product [Porites evermanni]|uniref:Roadblock/LAMTOR2 domain-containing protein n=1 Tax=Porites evermanni TaxID=104178 RepID=A0ABN8MBB6_9CNID|nr:unnamed protein product [Porites evermanni]